MSSPSSQSEDDEPAEDNHQPAADAADDHSFIEVLGPGTSGDRSLPDNKRKELARLEFRQTHGKGQRRGGNLSKEFRRLENLHVKKLTENMEKEKKEGVEKSKEGGGTTVKKEKKSKAQSTFDLERKGVRRSGRMNKAKSMGDMLAKSPTTNKKKHHHHQDLPSKQQKGLPPPGRPVGGKGYEDVKSSGYGPSNTGKSKKRERSPSPHRHNEHHLFKKTDKKKTPSPPQQHRNTRHGKGRKNLPFVIDLETVEDKPDDPYVKVDGNKYLKPQRLEKIIKFIQDESVPDYDEQVPEARSQEEEEVQYDPGLEYSTQETFQLLHDGFIYFQGSCQQEANDASFSRNACCKVKLLDKAAIYPAEGMKAFEAFRDNRSQEKEPEHKLRIINFNRQGVNESIQILGILLQHEAEKLEKCNDYVAPINHTDLFSNLFSNGLHNQIQEEYYIPPPPKLQQQQQQPQGGTSPKDNRKKKSLTPSSSPPPHPPTQPKLGRKKKVPHKASIAPADNTWIDERFRDDVRWVEFRRNDASQSLISYLTYLDARSLQPGQRITQTVLDELLTYIYSGSGREDRANQVKGLTVTSTFHNFDEANFDREVVATLLTDMNAKSARIVIFPLILGESHYVLVHYVVDEKKIRVYDPMKRDGSKIENPELKGILKKIIQVLQKVFGIPNVPPSITTIRFAQPSGLPLQTDYTNCGAFCLLTVEYLAQTPFWMDNCSADPRNIDLNLARNCYFLLLQKIGKRPSAPVAQ